MKCIRCHLDISISRQQGIHDECLQVWEKIHDYTLLEVFPTLFSGKTLNRAQGLALECSNCYHLAVSEDIWEKLPASIQADTRIVNSSSRRPLCLRCYPHHVESARRTSIRSASRSPTQYRRNADTRLRQIEREYQQEPTRERWIAWLRELTRVGNYPFTSEGVSKATQGLVTSFQVTEDGFVAQVEDVEIPAIEVRYRYRTGPDDFDWESYPRGAYTAKIYVQWHPKYDEEPVLHVDIQEGQQETYVAMPMDSEEPSFTRTDRIPGGEYHYVGGPVHNDGQLHIACRAALTAWESC